MFTYGFYNSLNGDRTYDAVQMSSIFDGVIMDGVYANVGELFAVVAATTGMGVIVKTGRAWFDHTWSLLDSNLPLDIEESDFLQTRIDAIVLEVDSRIEKRENSIKIEKGVPSVNPVKPRLLHEQGIYQHALAYVTINPGATSILPENIEIVVGKDETPFVQCPLKTVSISDLFNQWDGEFTTWFNNIKLQLTENVVTNLQRQIDEKVNVSDKASETDIKNGTPNKWVDAQAVSSLVPKVGSIVPSNEPDVLIHPSDYLKLDGSVVNVSVLPDDVAHKYVNLVPPAQILPSVYGSTNNVSNAPTVVSETMTIGNYDYIPYPDKIRKINRSTNAVSKTVTVSMSSHYVGVFGDKIVIVQKNKVQGSVYDANLNKLRDFDANSGSLTICVIGMISTSRIIIVGITSSQGGPSIWYTDNYFQNTTKSDVATVSGTYAAPIINSPYSMTTPLGNPGSILAKTDSGRLIILPQGYFSVTYLPRIYYSDDYGVSWNSSDMSSIFSAAGSTIGSSSVQMVGAIYGNIAYIVITNAVGNTDANAGSIRIVKVNTQNFNVISTSSADYYVPETGQYHNPFIGVTTSLSLAGHLIASKTDHKIFFSKSESFANTSTGSARAFGKNYNRAAYGASLNLDTGHVQFGLFNDSKIGKTFGGQYLITGFEFPFIISDYIVIVGPGNSSPGVIGKYNGDSEMHLNNANSRTLYIKNMNVNFDAIWGEIPFDFMQQMPAAGDQSGSGSGYAIVPAQGRAYCIDYIYNASGVSESMVFSYLVDFNKRILPPTGEYLKIQ